MSQSNVIRSINYYTDDDRPPEFSDDNLALIFADKHCDDLKFNADENTWFRWSDDETHWTRETTLLAFDEARKVCRAQAAKAMERSTDKPALARIASLVASAKTVANVERLARSDRRIVCTRDGWDADPFLLNTPGGVVDLATGDCRENRREDFCTRITAVAPCAPGTPAPLWERFLDRVTGGDAELIAFLQRVAGYSLTGSVREHALFFFYGSGRNGKGVWLNTVSRILNSYSATATMDAFMASHGTQHTTDLAMLAGARLVTAQETEEGRHWAEAKVKAITGGDPITARKMRQDNFTFEPSFKIAIAGNHKPNLRTVDEAIRARLHLIPFTVTIPEGERDPDLPDKLRKEWPAILTWMIEGCMDWQERGLCPPANVRAATSEYFADEDTFTTWIDECCTRDADSWERLSDLFGNYRDWIGRTGEQPARQKEFKAAMRARGFHERKRSVTGFLGLEINRPNYTDDPRVR